MKRYIAVILGVCFLGGCGQVLPHECIDEGMRYIEEMSYQSALEAVSRGKEAGEDAQLLARAEGLAYMGLGQYEEAAQCFMDSIANAGNRVTDLEIDTNFYLASALYKLERYSEAQEIYTAILNYCGKNEDAFFLRGCTYLKQSDYEKGFADFLQAFEMKPNNVDLMIEAFEELKSAGYEAEGLTFLQTVLDTRAASLTDAQKGTLYYYLNNYEDARIYLDSAVTNGNMEMSLLLGRTYEKLGDMNYACVVYQAYLDANMKNAEVYNNLGICYMTQGKNQEALEAFEAGIALGSSGVLQNLTYNRVVAYENLGRFSEAKSFMQEYLTFYPDDTKALREYEFLKTR